MLVTKTHSWYSIAMVLSVHLRGRYEYCGSSFPRAIKFSLPPLYPWHHSRDKMYQALPPIFRFLCGQRSYACARGESLGTRLCVLALWIRRCPVQSMVLYDYFCSSFVVHSFISNCLTVFLLCIIIFRLIIVTLCIGCLVLYGSLVYSLTFPIVLFFFFWALLARSFCSFLHKI